MSYTPGPWKLKHTSVHAGGIKIYQTGYCGAASVEHEMAAQETRKANARLIAQAPEMFELLQRIRQWDHLDTVGDGEYWKQQIDFIIRKATSEEQTQ